MSTESKYTKEFDNYWKTHEAALQRVAPKVLREERAGNGKMNTAGDWLLFEEVRGVATGAEVEALVAQIGQ